MRILISGLARMEQSPGGSQRYLSGLAAALRDAGHDVRVITGADLVNTSDSAYATRPARAWRSLVRLIVGIPRGVWNVARFRPDIVAVHFPMDGIGAALGARWSRRPTVIHFHGPWASEAAAAGRPGGTEFHARHAIETVTYAMGSRLVVLSDAFARLLADDYDMDPARITVVPGGLDLPPGEGHGSSSDCRRALGLPDRFTLVTVRRLVPRTGVDLAIETLATLREARPDLDAQLLVAGDGPVRGQLTALAADLAIADRVHFLGHFEDDRRWTIYGAGDVCLVSSRALEGFGYGALEGLASGRPTIVTDIGGLPEVVAPLEPRWVVPAEASAIAAALTALLADPLGYPNAAACRAHARRFSWRSLRERVLEVYRDAIREAAGESGRRRS